MRLIDADALIKSIKSHTVEDNGLTNDYKAGLTDSIRTAVALAENASTISAVPVVRGVWLVTDAYPHRVYCSLCYKTNVPNKEWLYEKNDYPKYCMWCGAKMEDKP